MAKKLIEVALPLDDINEAAAREKSIRHGHPSTLHLWWARRPLATARAVLFASIVDDPGDKAERQRLFNIIRKLVIWENLNDKAVLAEARAEILKATGGKIPEVFDLFAGGGTIPLEAQRLGLNVTATDLNPVAVAINRAMLELPAIFKDRKPLHSENLIDTDYTGTGALGLAADISHYGKELKKLAYKKLAALYPKINFGEENLTVIAWIWARTVPCPNPACQCQMPLVNSFNLSKKQKISFAPVFDKASNNISYEIRDAESNRTGTVSRNGAFCVRCGTPVTLDYIKAEGKAGRIGAQMVAIVAEGKSGRVYLPADEAHIQAAKVDKPDDFPDSQMTKTPDLVSGRGYGITHWHQLFTNRQLTALVTFQDLIDEAIEDIADENYASALKVYLAILIDKLVQYNSSNCPWDASRDGIAQIFGRQALPMIWTFAEANPFSNSTGSFDNMLNWVVEAVRNLPAGEPGKVYQRNAMVDNKFRDKLVSTDPPYYDNIGYANLSDFFFVWLRRALISIYPKLFKAREVPKAEEMVADQYRQGGKRAAQDFFEAGMRQALSQIYNAACDEYPSTIYYAFKQKALDGNSTGWLTMLNAVIRAGFIITGTWPMRTELVNGLKGETNSLTSSVVLVCRKRHSKKICPLREFADKLRAELPAAIEKMRTTKIAPVDMWQAAIGPAMQVYSRYENVLRADGTPVSVSDALRTINIILDEFLNEQDENLDADSRFYAALFSQYLYDKIPFGEIDNLARGRELLPEKLEALIFDKGGAYLKKPEELLALKDTQCCWILVHQLAETQEYEKCAQLSKKFTGDMEAVKNLAYRIYQILDARRQTQESVRYNNLVESWEFIVRQRLALTSELEQPKLDFE